MMINKKIKATKLRVLGLSYNEIRKQVKVSKSTLSLWLKGVRLNAKNKKRLYTKQIEFLSHGVHSQKARREKEIQELIKIASFEIEKPTSLNSLRLMGVALYWAEGSKGSMLQFTNSDPHMINFFVRWLNIFFKTSPSALKAYLNIYPQQNERLMKEFWSDLTKIPIANFKKTTVKSISKNYKKNNLYYGTIKIYVPKSTDLKHRIFGWLDTVLNSFNLNVELTLRRWQKLKEVERPVNLSPHSSVGRAGRS